MYSFRSSAAEVLALSVKELFPRVILLGGGETSLGFYYDFIFTQSMHENALTLIEEKMRAVVKREVPIEAMTMMRKNAIDFFAHHKQKFQVEVLQNCEDQLVEICKIDQFYDLAHGPFVENTKLLAFFKLLSLEHLSSEIEPVTRIQGTVFPNPQALKKFLKSFEIAKKRNHLVLGKEMELFQGDETEVQWGLKGEIIREELRQVGRKMYHEHGWQFVSTSSQEEKALMHTRLVQLYLEPKLLPLCVAEQYSVSSDLPAIDCAGLWNSQEFTADSAHIFCTQDQIVHQLKNCLELLLKTLSLFGVEGTFSSTSFSSKCAVNKGQWKRGEQWLKEAFEANEIILTEEISLLSPYGPRVVLCIEDVFGRKWETASIGIDFIHSPKSSSAGPIFTIAFSLFGRLERVVAYLLEKYSGKLPFFAAAEQIRIVTVEESSFSYAHRLYKECMERGFRVKMDDSTEKLGAKIHAAEKNRVPYIVIVGKKEEQTGTVTLRDIARTSEFTCDTFSFFDKIAEERIKFFKKGI